MQSNHAPTLEFTIFRGDERVATHRFDLEVIKIGRLRTNHLCLADASIARMHAVIEVAGAEVRIIDLGSASGTTLNGRPIDKSAALRGGDVLGVGPYNVAVDLRAARPVAPAQAPQQAPRRPAPTMTIDAGEFEVQSGRRVAEVVAAYRGTILDVQHVGQAAPRRSRASHWLTAGGALILGGFALFSAELSEDWDGYQQEKIAAATAGAPTPAAPGSGLGGFGLGLALLGLVPLAVGLTQSADRSARDYTIGEGHGASFPIAASALPTPGGFPLIEETADGGHALNFTATMAGVIARGDESVSLAELIRGGLAATDGERYRVPLAADARCRITCGDVTFFINAVAPGRVVATSATRDRPFWLYNAGSFAVVGSLLMLSQMVPATAQGLDLAEEQSTNRFVGFLNQPDRSEPEPERPTSAIDAASDSEAGGSQGGRHVGEEGRAGSPRTPASAGRVATRGPRTAIPMLPRNFDPEMSAREAGILGILNQNPGHVLATPYGQIAQGNDDADAWGALTGAEIGEAYGVGGMGLVGSGRAGGGTAEGTVGLGRVGTIGTGGRGSGSSYGGGGGTGFSSRTKVLPVIRQAKAKVQGALDKDIVRRIVRAHINEVRNCYNAGLAKDPTIGGRVAIQFSIGSGGNVPMAVVAESTIKDPEVGRCVAKAVRRWKFPKPNGGGSVIVTYPFVLQTR
ncbi:MAG: TonB family protein [Myxococcales bacterium]|nr:TonB family protein [Myxococcales bacterium]